MTYRQLEIRWVDLEPTRGAETQKKRPCVILQSTLLNKDSKTFIVAPLLPDHKTWPFAVNIMPSKMNSLDKERHVNVKQMRAVDISRIGDRKGTLETDYLAAIHAAIEMIFGIGKWKNLQ